MTNGQKTLLFLYGIATPFILFFAYLHYGSTLQVAASVSFMFGTLIWSIWLTAYLILKVRDAYYRNLPDKYAKLAGLVLTLLYNAYRLYRITR